MNIKSLSLAFATAALSLTAAAAGKVNVSLNPTDSAPVIEPEIYGQFTEHLGRCIYGGIWVGEDSEIPNTRGYRNDVLEAIRELKVPVMRWPGGCFADEYHWMDGIGPREQRPRMVNTNWGGTVEDNSFGTHEFLDLCELTGVEPYISGNVGSGSVEELAKWVEYMTANDGPMAKLRKENGREKPWKLKYLGIGNETWGCGGNMTPEYYSDIYRRYATYCRNFNGNQLYKIGCGADAYNYNWTDVCMKNAGRMMDGISLHYYCVDDWSNKGAAREFDQDGYYWLMGKAFDIDTLIRAHSQIMDKYDPEKRVGLLVDEWGTWWEVEPGTNPGHLYQQNTMRDALVAALSLNVFNSHADRVRMANIAQFATVLQAMLLTKDEFMVKTPTFYVFKSYAAHQGARLVPLTTDAGLMTVRKGRTVPVLTASASVKDGVTTVSLVNVLLDKPQEVVIDLGGIKASKV
ncbi:alpha-N-arabinofuranosidase, partial [Duncaniella muris]|uniref:alpha-N-arabinofuranosidase n=1 Tax=Duncaniella muris TaxID=2094150 RepID=UPI003F73423F